MRPAAPPSYTHHVIDETSEGSRAVRDRTATAAVSPSRYEVILVSRVLRCPLRGRHRMPATTL
ncbi:hypothetical protein DN402_00400 [Streptomyces sp. SW4]|nr:hypothetical protein DN402_00400 [Streptomyces sp. SW4]